MLEAGVRLAERYEIISSLGAGGMGEVYRARDLRLGREVAIKILSEHLAKDAAALARFDREAKALAALSHPNIIAIYDFVITDQISFVVMELLEGDTLRKQMGGSPVPWTRAVEIIATIADGLAAAHSRGIIHRDLKPENIFLTLDSGIKILDFGLARVTTAQSETSHSSIATAGVQSDPGTIVGTVQYMSPEQLRQEPVDARSDIFTLGCILSEMITAARPFARNTTAEMIAAILTGSPDLADIDKKAPPEVKQIIMHCLEKNPEARFQTARDFAFALKSALSGSVISRGHIAPPAQQPRRRKTSKRVIDSLAVLPLANVSGDSNMEYLSDGITESIINILSQLPKLRVMARSTVFRYKGQDADPQKIGSDLNVGAVLTGRVILRGDALSIQTELVDVFDGAQLWGEHYRRKASDIFAIQEEISQEISEKLRLKLRGEEKNRLAKRYTENTMAYQLFLKGRFHWSKRTGESLKKAIEYFQQAIEEDRSYALAYAGLADCYNLMSAYGVLSPIESVPVAKEAALKALEIDNTLAEGHEALAHVKMLYDWDWTGAEEEFKRAMDLNPNYATAHQRYAIQLSVAGRFKEASAEIRRAQQLDPLSLIINTDVGLILFFQSRFDEAIEQYKKTLDLDENFSVAHIATGLALEQKGLYEEAIAAFERGVRFSGDRTFLSSPAHTYAVWGKKDEARKLLAELQEISKQRYVSPYRMAIIYNGLGETDQAFDWLERACQARSVWLIHLHLKVDPRINNLRDDPRFKDLLRRLGF